MWAHAIATALGIWLMASPQVLGYNGAAMVNDQIVGPIIATFACVAIWEVMRSLRWVNVVLGAWLVLVPWVLGYAANAATLNSMAVGAALVGLSLVKGRMRTRMNGGWRMLWSSGSHQHDGSP